MEALAMPMTRTSQGCSMLREAATPAHSERASVRTGERGAWIATVGKESQGWGKIFAAPLAPKDLMELRQSD